MRLSWIPKFLAGLGGVALVGVHASGCADPDSELFIRGVVKPQQGLCEIKAEADSTIYTEGYLDASLSTEYTATLLIGNQLVSQTTQGAEKVRTETNRVTIQSADVTVENAKGEEIDSFSVPTSGFADPTTGGQAGYGLATVPLLSRKAALKLAAGGRANARVRIFGRTLGGTDVRSDEFNFVIHVCAGCLISFPLERTNTSLPLPNCAVVSDAGGGTSNTTPCRIGQDEVVDCGLCRNSNAACRGNGP